MNPIYLFEMTYEEYCVWHETLPKDFLYGPPAPHDKELWNSIENLKKHIEMLKERLENPSNSIGAMIAYNAIEQAKARLEYLERL
jgi:hypothetical protein